MNEWTFGTAWIRSPQVEAFMYRLKSSFPSAWLGSSSNHGQAMQAWGHALQEAPNPALGQQWGLCGRGRMWSKVGWGRGGGNSSCLLLIVAGGVPPSPLSGRTIRTWDSSWSVCRDHRCWSETRSEHCSSPRINFRLCCPVHLLECDRNK